MSIIDIKLKQFVQFLDGPTMHKQHEEKKLLNELNENKFKVHKAGDSPLEIKLEKGFALVIPTKNKDSSVAIHFSAISKENNQFAYNYISKAQEVLSEALNKCKINQENPNIQLITSPQSNLEDVKNALCTMLITRNGRKDLKNCGVVLLSEELETNYKLVECRNITDPEKEKDIKSEAMQKFQQFVNGFAHESRVSFIIDEQNRIQSSKESTNSKDSKRASKNQTSNSKFGMFLPACLKNQDKAKLDKEAKLPSKSEVTPKGTP